MSGFDDQPLKDWLNKKNSGHEDAFDKEAREGFDMLTNEKEALQLKSTVDKKIQEQLFEDKKSRRPLYWMAAAAMLIISGLSAYFIINDTSNSTNMAVTRMPEPDDRSPALEKSFDDKSAEIASAPTEEPAVIPQKTSKQVQPTTKTEPAAEADYARASYETEKDIAPGKDDVLQPEQITEQEPAKPVLAANKKTNDAEEHDEESKASDVASFKNDAKKEKSARAKLVEPMAASPVYSQSKALSANNCFYKGGTEVLMKDLHKKLSAKNLNRNFDAVLFISANKKVIKADLIKKENFTEPEQSVLLNILKSLDDFKFEITPEPSIVSEFTLHYLAK